MCTQYRFSLRVEFRSVNPADQNKGLLELGWKGPNGSGVPWVLCLKHTSSPGSSELGMQHLHPRPRWDVGRETGRGILEAQTVHSAPGS